MNRDRMNPIECWHLVLQVYPPPPWIDTQSIFIARLNPHILFFLTPFNTNLCEKRPLLIN